MPHRNSGTIRGGNNNGGNSILEAVSNVDGSKDNKAIDLQEKRRQTLRKKYNDALAKNDLATVKRIEELRKKYRLDTENEAAEIAKQKDEEARREEILTRAKERERDKAAAKERREEDIAIQKELAKEQLETATSFGEKMQAYGQLFSAGLKEAGDHLKEGLSKAANATATALSGSVDKYLGTYSQYMSAIEARIQGAFNGMTYESLNDIIRQNTAGSPYVKYTEVLSNLSELVSKGTMVNLAQRAFLATVSNKIATTFDAFDSNLLRIVKLQQMDTTASRLGMEAELTKLFNYYFSDSSYLTDAFDSVTASLTNLSSQLDAATSVELEYQVQKWLGALGSTGADSSTLSTIAQAINALGTGDVDWLTGNTAMQNLLVMASNRAGLDYSEMLVNGVSSMDTNLLLGAMIEYIKEVTSDVNNVVKSQYAELFGLTISDITAFQNISNETISTLYRSAMTYNDTLTSLSQQLSQVSSRIHISEQINNVIDNILAATGMNIANSTGMYMTYKIADMVESITGGIYIPTVTVLGSGITLPNSIEEYIKMGVVGISTIGSLFDAVGNWASGTGLNLDRWSAWGSFAGGDKGTYTGFTSTNELSTTTSAMGTISNSDSKGMQQSIYDEQQQSAEEVSGTDTEEADDTSAILKFLKNYFEQGGQEDKPLKVAVISDKSSSNSSKVTIDKNSGLATGGDMLSLLTAILNVLIQKGTTDNPLIATLLNYGLTDANINDILADYIPGVTI